MSATDLEHKSQEEIERENYRTFLLIKMDTVLRKNFPNKVPFNFNVINNIKNLEPFLENMLISENGDISFYDMSLRDKIAMYWNKDMANAITELCGI